MQVPTNPSGPKKSGWDSPGGGASEVPSKPKGRRRRALDDDSDGDESKPVESPTRNDIAHMQDDDGPTAYIPDLEDEEENMSLQVAVAPSHKSSRVPTIGELDQEIDMALPSTNEVGVDLSVLQSYLIPQEQLQEDDEPWHFEHELQMLASELMREQEERDGSALPGHKPRRGPAQLASAS